MAPPAAAPAYQAAMKASSPPPIAAAAAALTSRTTAPAESRFARRSKRSNKRSSPVGIAITRKATDVA